MKTTTDNNRGFVLISSLIFLVVVTLLAVSAMNSSTLQEKMASNMREKSRAQQIADAALRQGEMLLEDTAFDTPPAPGSLVSIEDDEVLDANNDVAALKVWTPRGMLNDDDDDENDALAFLASGVWDSNQPMDYLLDQDAPTAEFYVEYDRCLPRDLSPNSRAICDGTAIYRITARAKGQNPSAVAVTQSLFAKHY